ncbi:alkaline phosphatase family protein [Roseivirga sp.]|uniref:alkaline phosphatase family protein n=1 Tax=Roseivirga sp. TaxID=1964215 RepID=UPI003B51C376
MNTNTNRVFDHVLIIMFENQYRSYVMDNPYFRSLAKQGIDMANYFGVMHPSQTNYISSIAGELCNMTDDDRPPKLLTQRTIVDLIEESPYRLDWKAYMDSYIPQNQAWSSDLVPQDEYPYMIKHNPFSSFCNIVHNQQRWNKIQNEADLFSDLLNGILPAYSWFTPNMWNDGHYVDGTNPIAIPADKKKQPKERAPKLVNQAAEWLEGFFGKLNFPGPDSHLPPNTLVVVTYDEADFEALYDKPQEKKYFYDGPNQIYTVLLGDMIEPGAVAYEGYNHYSLIKTIEHNFGLGSLEKNDKEANWFKFLWGETFIWEAPEEVPIKTQGPLASAGYKDTLYLVFSDEDDQLNYTTFDGDYWAESRLVGAGNLSTAAMASTPTLLSLAAVDKKGELSIHHYTESAGWSVACQALQKGVSKVTMAAIDGGNRLMLAYTNQNGDLYSMVTDDQGAWQAAVKVGFSTEGEIQLGVLGPSVYLIFQDTSTHQMMVCSYNTADFNVVTLDKSAYNGPQSNTTKDKWSPNIFPVAHFSYAAYPGTPKQKEPVTQPYEGTGAMACATLDGVMHLCHNGVSNELILTEEFSIHGIMTPEQPISYDVNQSATTNSGYGTLAQAGWSEQTAITGAYNAGPASMSQVNGELLLIYTDKHGHLSLVRGGY